MTNHNYLSKSLSKYLALLLFVVTFPIITSFITTPAANAASVDTSTVGYTFDISLAPSRGSGTNWNIYISSSGNGSAVVDWPVTVANSNLSLTSGGISAVNVAAQDRVAVNATGQQSKNIKITATVGISVYACWIESSASDCTNFYPTSTWGTRYRTLYTPASVGTQTVNIVTAGSAATVTLKPIYSVTGTPNLTANTATNISISANSSYQIATSTGDYSGMEISSNVPISVVNGAECVNFGSLFNAGGACDLASQSVPPISSWGTNFYSVNYRNYGTTGSGYRILADQNNTQITISGDTSGITTTTKTLNAGEVYTFNAYLNTGSAPHKSIAITSNNPILVGHYMFNGGTGAYKAVDGVTTTTGDPSMSYVTPFQQFLGSYNFASPTGLSIANINLVTPTSAISDIRLDGVAISSGQFRTIAGSSWSSAQIAVSTGTHQITSTQALGIEAYGAGNYDSYAYTGGANTAPLANVAALTLSSSNTSGTVGQQACIPVSVLDANNAPVLGIRVDASISGVSSLSGTNATSDSSGIANICYTGNNVGVDTVSFSANGFTSIASLTWSLTVPNISYSPSTVALATNSAMPTLSPTNSGGTASSWSISPSLPGGLSINTSTGVISGTPTSDNSAAAYTITATNSAGSDTATVTISSMSASVGSIAYSPNTLALTLDTAMSAATPSTSGTFPTWSISPDLPTGLVFNSQSGVISGTPTRVTSSSSYTVTATNSAGSTTTSITISVSAVAPNISYSPTSYTAYVGIAISSIAPSNSGSPATSWSISPTLPSGLSFNTSNGNISGSPSASSSATTYTITGTNSAGSSSAAISITVQASVSLPDISISPSSISTPQNQAMNAVTPSNIGGTATSWSVSPTLPTGISFSTSTGRISGTPTTIQNATNYTITATNSAGSDTLTVSIEITVSYNGNQYQYDANTGSGNGPSTQTFGGIALSAQTNTFTAPNSYVFSRWCTVAVQAGSSCSGTAYLAGATLPTPTSSLITLYAVWASADLSVTYNANSATSGTVPVDTNVYHNSDSATVLANYSGLIRQGYSFGGWSINSNGSGTIYNSGLQIQFSTQNIVLYAVWTANTITITYNNNGATSGSPQRSSVDVTSDTHTVGSTAITLPLVGTLSRTGYTFNGWSETTTGSSVGSTYSSSIDKILYAVWTANNISISYSQGTNAGNVVQNFPTNATYTYNQRISLPTLDTSTVYVISSSNYRFAGWDNGTTKYVGGSNYLITSNNETLTALWAKVFEVSYILNGGSGTTTTPDSSDCVSNLCNDGSVINLISSPSRTGYLFDGWIDESGNRKLPGDSHTVTSTNHILSARWISNSVTVTYLPNGGSTTPTQSGLSAFDTFTVASAITRTGYTFTGWLESSTSRIYGPNHIFTLGTSAITFTAQWNPEIYSITYDWNNATGSVSNNDTFTVGGNPITLPSVGDHQRSNLEFEGWSLSRDGSVINNTYTPTASVVLFAKWGSGRYTVTYNPNYNGASNSNDSVTVGSSLNLATNPVRTNYDFQGWYDASSGGNLIGKNSSSYRPTGNATLYAQWMQSSLAGVSPSSRILMGTLNANGLIDATFSGSVSSNSVSISVPAGSLPDGTTISIYLVSDFTSARAILTSTSTFYVSAIVAWLAPDGSVPDTAVGKPITVEIRNPNIKAGSSIYSIIGNTSTLLGTSTADGVATSSITSDPQMVVAATKPSVPLNVIAGSNENGQSTITWSAPTSNGGAAISGYTVTAVGNTQKTCSTNGTLSCIVTGLTNGATYTFTVTATNSAGTSDPSAQSNGATPNSSSSSSNNSNSSNSGNSSTTTPVTTLKYWRVYFDINVKNLWFALSPIDVLESNVSTLILPGINEVITRDGFEFLGWSLTSTSQILLSSNFQPSSDVMLYAVWHELQIQQPTTPQDPIGTIDEPIKVAVGAIQPVGFKIDSTKLSNISLAVLKKIQIKKVAAVTIKGYASPIGSTIYNKQISIKRAKTVGAFLKKLNPKLKIKIIGMGTKINPVCKAYKNQCAFIEITKVS